MSLRVVVLVFSWNDKCVDGSCKWRAEFFHRSFVVVHTEDAQWKASSTREKSSLTKLSVTEIPVPIGGFLEINAHAHTRRSFFFLPLPSAPGIRLLSSYMGMKDGGCFIQVCLMWGGVNAMSKNTYPTFQYLPHEACTLEHFLVYLCAVSKWELASCRDFSFHTSLHRDFWEWKQQDGSFRGFCWHLAASGCLNKWCH